MRRTLERSPLYSEELGIDLAKQSDAEYFRWFLASLLFGARISETTAKNTYRSFIRHGLTNPKRILKAGWDFLVYPVMREGGYVRYDGRKSTQVLRNCEVLIADYGGRLSRLHDAARAALTKLMELTAWALTCLYLGDYYRTYPTTVEDEVRAALAAPEHFVRGPISVVRDSPSNLAAGFTVRDGNYLSARWPGDAHRFANEFALMLEPN